MEEHVLNVRRRVLGRINSILTGLTKPQGLVLPGLVCHERVRDEKRPESQKDGVIIHCALPVSQIIPHPKRVQGSYICEAGNDQLFCLQKALGAIGSL